MSRGPAHCGRRVSPGHSLRAGLAVLGAVVLAGCGAIPVESDRWTGRDKLEHFATSAVIAAGYMRAAGEAGHAARGRAEAAALVISLGAFKELGDARVPGKGWSWRDMAWNVAGALLGARLHDLPAD